MSGILFFIFASCHPLKKINASKATGPDGIPPRLVKEFAYELSVKKSTVPDSERHRPIQL